MAKSKIFAPKNNDDVVLGNCLVVDTSVLINEPRCIYVMLGYKLDGSGPMELFDENGQALANDNLNNIVCLPIVTINQLRNLKNSPGDTGFDAREALRIIKDIQLNPQLSSRLQIVSKRSFSNLPNFDQKDSDNQIVAIANYLLSEKSSRGIKRFKAVKIISDDIDFPIITKDFLPEIKVESFRLYETDIKQADFEMKSVKILESDIEEYSAFKDWYQPYREQFIANDDGSRFSPLTFEDFTRPYNTKQRVAYRAERDGEIYPNDPVKIEVYKADDLQFAKPIKVYGALLKGSHLTLIKDELSAVGISPFSMSGNGVNWYQACALAQLLDPDIDFVFLKGGAGTGKTLLSLAAALEQRHLYRNIFLTNPMVPLDGVDNIGFLPGSLSRKMAPWMQSFEINLNFIKEMNVSVKELPFIEDHPLSSKELSDRAKQQDKETENEFKSDTQRKNRSRGNSLKNKLITTKEVVENLKKDERLNHIATYNVRGQTWHNVFAIIDDAQNLTVNQVRTITTRMGRGTKMIFTGDLDQIDRFRYINRRTSGLAHAVKMMHGDPHTAISFFNQVVRSRGAASAQKRI